MKTVLRALVPALVFLLAACGGSPAAPESERGSCTLEVAGDADAHLVALLRAEGELVVAQQIDALMALWDEAGQVVDAKHTPADPGDDQRWIGLDAVRHRYVRIVFPGNPQPPPPDAPQPELAITVDGDRATVRATTQIGGEVAPAGDQWGFVRHGGCWSIESLTYNLEAAP